MSAHGRWKVVCIELSEPLTELAPDAAYEGVRAVFFWQGTPLGHWRFLTGELPLAPAQLANVGAKAIGQAAGDGALVEGFRSALPGLPEPPLIDSAAALAALVSLERPLAEMNARSAADWRPSLSLSVAICTRERPHDLARCLRSLAASAETPDEILVIDNAPLTSETREVVSRFSGVRYHCEARRGLSAARNTALALASGEIVAFVDDDVCVPPSWTARIRRAFDHPEVMVVTGLVLPAELETPAQMMFETFQFFHQGYRKRRFDLSYFEVMRSKGVPTWSIGAGANMAVRRRAFELEFEFDTRLGPGVFGGCGEDSEFWYQILAAGWTCVYDPRAFVFHYHRRELSALRRQVRQYMQGHVAALLMQFRKSGDLGNLRRVLFQLPAEYFLLFLRLLLTGFALDNRILFGGALGCFSGLRALLRRPFVQAAPR